MPSEPIDIPIRETGASSTAAKILGIGTASKSAAGAVGILVAGLAGLAAFGAIIKFAANYQTELLGVQKTTGLANKEIEKLSVRFREMTKILPNSAAELANIGTIAGQLGIQNTEDILAFTDTIAKIASVTEFTTQAAAEDLARISNLFDLPIQQVGKLGSALNALENTTTATAPKIAEFVKRIAVVGKQIGLSVGDVAGLSATLVDLGFNAELAGTAISKTFTEMQINAEDFAQTMGLTAEEFRMALEEDAIGTIQRWAAEVGSLPNNQLIQQLKAVGIEGSRALQVFGALAPATGKLAKNIDIANKAFKEGTSLQEEFDIQIGSVNNQFILAKNRVADLVLGIGQGLLPSVSAAVKQFIAWFDSLNITEFQLRNVGAFLGGVFLDTIKAAGLAILAIRIGFNALAASVLFVSGKIGLLLIPFANLTDLIGITDNATETVMANLVAMDKTAENLFKNAGKSLGELNKGFEVTRVEVANTFRTLEDLRNKQDAAAVVKPKTGPKSQVVLPFTKNELKEFSALLNAAKSPAEVLAEKIKEINFLLSRPGGLTETQGQAAFTKVLTEANDAYIDSIAGLREVLDSTISPQDIFAKRLELINQLLIDGTLNEDEAARAIGIFGNALGDAAEEVEGLAQVLRDAETPLDRLNQKLETVVRLFNEGDGFIDAEQASLAIKKYTDTYNDEMDRITKKTKDANKEILDAINGLANSMESRLTDVFIDLTKGGGDFKEFFTGVIDEIIRQVLRLAVIKPFIDAIFKPAGGGGIGNIVTSLISGLFGGGASSAVVSGSVACLPLAPSFAHGGGFRLSGSGGTDSRLIPIRMSPGETARITTPQQERGMGGDVNNVSVSVTINTDGSSSENSEGEKSEFVLQAGNIIKSTVLDMMRPSEPLGKALNRR